MIGTATIATLIPHAGRMCLLDDIVSWNDETICCRSSQHRALDNPLRQGGRLGIFAGIEFAAQAMAAHGRLAGAISERPRAGFIASLRSVVCRCERLDQLDDDIVITATKLMGEGAQVMYAFTVACRDEELLAGRATVVLQGAPL